MTNSMELDALMDNNSKPKDGLHGVFKSSNPALDGSMSSIAVSECESKVEMDPLDHEDETHLSVAPFMDTNLKKNALADLNRGMRKKQNTRKLELPSFADQLALASSSTMAPRAAQPPIARALRDSPNHNGLDLKHLLNTKRDPRHSTGSSTSGRPRRVQSALLAVSEHDSRIEMDPLDHDDESHLSVDPFNQAMCHKNPNPRKFELPSFADQLALASSSCVVPKAQTAGAQVLLDSSDHSNDFDLRLLLRRKTPNHSTGSPSSGRPIRRVKSALKKTSSYGIMEAIGENIPISTDKKNWKNLPVPKLPEKEAKLKRVISDQKLALLKRAALSTSCLVPPKTGGTSFESPTTMKRNVSFSKVAIREYDVTVGDHPCKKAPPVALDWAYQEKEHMDVMDYEVKRLTKSRSQSDLRMSPIKRRFLLKHAGLAESEIQAAAREAQKTHQQRTQTLKRLPLMKVEDMMESAARKAKRRLTSRKKSRKSPRSRLSSDDLMSSSAVQSASAPNLRVSL